MIRLERDPAFWRQVASHPQVANSIPGLSADVVCQVVASERATPLAAEHGGFIFARIDGLGRVMELHSLFTPEGWGREVHRAGALAARWVFAEASAVITYEIEGNPRSRPPKSVGFRPMDDFKPSPIGSARTWIVTRDEWLTSPACKRLEA